MDWNQRAWNEELVVRGEKMTKLHVEAHRANGNSDGGDDSNDLGLVPMVLDAMVEAGEVRKQGAFAYEAGEGDVKASKGRKDGVVSCEDRHGVGLRVAARVSGKWLKRGGLDSTLERERVMEVQRLIMMMFESNVVRLFASNVGSLDLAIDRGSNVADSSHFPLVGDMITDPLSIYVPLSVH